MEGRFEKLILSRLDDGVCLRWRGQSWTGETLRAEVSKTAKSLGVQTGRRIGIRLPHSPSLVIAVLAVLQAGGVCVPIEPSQPQSRVEALLSEVGAQLMLEDLEGLQGLEASGLDSACSTQKVDDPAFIFFTSGSTGRPKGVFQTHRQVYRGQLGPLRHLNLGIDDRVLLRTPISTSGLACEIGWPLLTGGRLILAADEQKNDPEQLVRLMQAEGVTVLSLTPSLLSLLLKEKRFPQCRQLRYIISAGEPLGMDLYERVETLLPGRLTLIYGTTEAPSTTLRLPGSSAPMTVVGSPVHTKKIRIVHGEIQVGDGIAQGYWGQEKLTEERFLVEPKTGERWYRTGDLGKIQEDGTLELLGRADRQIQIRGFRVEPAEVEAALRSHPALAEAAVGLRSGQLVAWVTSKEEISPLEVRRYAITRLPPQMLPDSVVILPSLPRNSGGKLDRQALPDPPSDTPVSSSDDREGKVLALMRQALRSATLGPDDDFFEHGGHSMLAMQLLQGIEDEFAQRLPGSLFLEKTTARSLVEALEKKRSGPQLVPLNTYRTGAPLYCLPGVSGESLEFQKFAGELEGLRPVYGFQARGTVERGDSSHIDLRQAARDYLALLTDEPLHLVGFSAGAAYALEMALQWQEQNRKVAWLAIIDAPAPGHEYKKFLNAFWPSNWKTLCRDLPPRVRSFKIREILKNLFPEKDQSSAQSNLRWEVVKTISRQSLEYMPQGRFEGELTLFRASVQPLLSSHSPDLGWSRWCKKVRVVTFPGHHFTLLDNPSPIMDCYHWKSPLGQLH